MEQHAIREQFELEDEHWWFSGRRAVIWSLLRRTGVGNGLAEPQPTLRVLDAGCGTGRNLIEFGRLGDARGVDASPDAVQLCLRRGIESVSVGRLESLPFPDGSFDLIFATDVIEHVDDDRAALSEMRRVCAPGGLLLATVPAYRWLWSEHDEANHHFRRYTLRRLRPRLRATGWEPLEWSYFNSTLLAPIAAFRLAARARPARANGRPDADLKPTPAAVNWLLEQPMRLEAALIARGAHLPAGVSIGVVCRAAG